MSCNFSARLCWLGCSSLLIIENIFMTHRHDCKHCETVRQVKKESLILEAFWAENTSLIRRSSLLKLVRKNKKKKKCVFDILFASCD